MKFKDVSGLTAAELTKKIGQNKAELFDLRMKNSLGQVSNPLQLRTLRRQVAQLMTALNQKLAR